MRNFFTLSIVFILFLGMSTNAQEMAITKSKEKPFLSYDSGMTGNPVFLDQEKSITKRTITRNTYASYDFEGGMPANFELIGGECDCCVWQVGTDGGSSYFPIPAHDGKYAFVNDDECDDIMNDVWMILPPIDFSAAIAPRLLFDSHSTANDDLTVKVSIDNKETWTDFPLTSRGAWRTVKVSLLEFVGEASVHIAFHYNDNGGWSWGWAVDNIVVDEPLPHDLVLSNVLPYGGVTGKTIVPKVLVYNDGQNDEDTWSVTLTTNTGYSSTKTGILVTVDKTVTIDMDDWTLTAGEHVLTATVIFEGDENPENNTMNRTINVSAYEGDAYLANLSAGTYNKFDLKTGTLTKVGTITSDPFPRCEEWDGNYIHRLDNNGTISHVYPDGKLGPIGKLSGFEDTNYGIGMTYDWNNDAWYLVDNKGAFYSLNMNTFVVTKIADSGTDGNIIIAIDFAHDGFIYGPCFDGNLYKINPATGIFTAIGKIGFAISYGQDVSFDCEHLRLYTVSCGAIMHYGYYNLQSGEFVTIKDMGGQQYTPFVILKEPMPFNTLTMTVTDGSDPVEGADITITADNAPPIVYVTDEDGKIVADFTNGDYGYDIYHFYYFEKSGEFTINSADVSISETLVAKATYNVTFNIKNVDGGNLNATVYLKYKGATLHQGQAINGRIVFYNVVEADYTYDVEYKSYETITDVELIVDGTKTVNVTMTEIIGLPPAWLKISGNNGDATLTWVSYVPYPVSYWDPTYTNFGGFYQYVGTGYGVIFDLTDYPYAILSDVDFQHYPFLVDHPNDYVIHVIDMNKSEKLFTSSTLTTTGNNAWEYVKLNNINAFGGKKIGVFLEGKTLYYGVYTNPMLATDYKTPNKNSYSINLQTFETTILSGNEFLMTLWILTDDGGKVAVGDRALKNFEVFLDGVSKGTTTNKSYTYSSLNDGEYLAGVRAVYETGTTSTTTLHFTVVDGNITNINDMKLLFTYYVDKEGLLRVKSDANTVNLNVYTISGQLIGTSKSNYYLLPQQGVYVVNAIVDGKPVNFKVVW